MLFQLCLIPPDLNDDAGKVVREADSSGNPIQGIAHTLQIPIGPEPVMPDHSASYPGHGCRHQMLVMLQLLVDPVNKGLPFNIAELAPVFE